MFKSFKSLKTVRTLFDQAGNLYRVAKRVLEKVGSRFRSGYKRFAKNSLFYTEALPTVTGIAASYTKGAGFESINQSQVAGLRSFSAYDIIGASSIDDQYLTFKPNVSSSDYPKPTFDPDDSVGAGIFTKSLWNHNQLAYSEDYFTGTTSGYFSNFQSANWTDTGETLMDGMKIFKYLAPTATDHYLTTKPHERYITYDDSKLSFFSFYMKADDNPSLRLNDLRIYFNDLTPETNTRVDVFGWGPTRLIPDQPLYTDRFSVEDVGNGWVRFTMLPGYFEWMRDTYGNLKSGDDLRFTILFNDVPAGGSVYLAGLQYEQHPLNKPSWSHNELSGRLPFPEGVGAVVGSWNTKGAELENVREERTDPFGKESVVWIGKDLDSNDSDGGFGTAPNVSLDPNSSYRFSCFVKRNTRAADDRTLYMGLAANFGSDPTLAIKNADTGTLANNPYFIVVRDDNTQYQGEEFNVGEWYLFTGFLDADGTARGSIHPDQGAYDLNGNQFYINNNSFELSSTTTATEFRLFQYRNPAGQGDEIEFWAPRIDKLDGNEPSISDLLNPIDNPNYPPVTKATPYVGNDAIPANVHRHNWLNYTNDLATSSNWNFTRVDLQPSTIGTSVYSGETAYEVVPDDPIGNWPIIYTSGDGISFNADETKVASVYIKSHDKNPTFMPSINSNLSGLDKWSVGTGDDPSTDWIEVPDVDENERLYLDTPFGGLDVVWRATNLDTESAGEGGYRTTHFNIDRTKKYRFSQFVRTSTHNDTTIYLGQTDSQSVDPTNRRVIKGDDGLPAENFHYFATSYRLPSSDEWYLMVGHIHPEGTSTPIKDAESGLYDMSGNLVDNSAYFRDFVFSSTTTETMIRGLSYYNPSTNPDTVDFWHPRVDAIDGNEPSIERLLDSVKAKQPAVNFPAFAEIPWLDEGLTDFWNTSGWNAVDTANATTTTSSLKTPFNTEEVVVVANNEPSPDGAYEGGISTHGTFFLPIDNTKKYRYSIFAKKATNEGGIYLGPSNGSEPSIAVRRLDNCTHNNNPYFINNRDFGTSEWVLLVGHIWPHTTAVGTANDPDTGVWSMDGTKLLAYTSDIDLMTSSTTTEQGFRAFFYGDVTDDLNKAYFWQPRIDIVDGTEPSIEELLRLQPGLTINLLDFSAPTKIHRAAFGVDASGAVYPKYIIGGELDGFGVEEVGDGWYRAWAYKEGLDSVSNTVEGDDLYYYLYFGDASQPFADVSATINNDFRSTLIMKPMVERLGIDQVVSDPPTAYQEVSDNTWPSVSAIPYHQVAKEVELSIKDDTTGSSYTAKAYWDGGKLYNYGPRITNQDVEITQLQDGWHKFGTGIRGLGDGTINAGDTASMTFSYAASSNPRSKTLISGPILANTGSEKSSKVNYSVGTQTPGVNFIPNTADWDDYFGGSFLTPANPAVITMDKINTPGPYDPSSFIFSSDEGVQQSRDYVLYYPYSGRDEVKFSESDTVVTHIHAKSLWNYNELPYTRNILDDPNFTDGSDQYGSFYSHAGEYTVVDGETGPDGYSKVLSFTSPFVTPNRTVLLYPFFDWNWYNHRWDENMISTFSVFVKAPDNADETPTSFMFNFMDSTSPFDSESQYFDWGPNQAPKEAVGNAKSKGFVEDVGDGWYRLSVSVSGLLDEDGINTENGDKQRIQWYVGNYEAGQNFKICQPQMEHHIINDTNLLKPSWDWYEIQGPATINNVNGWVGYGPGENGIELREDPFGLSSLCWVGYDYNAPDPQDGGYTDSPFVDIDPNSTYRYSFFAKLGKEKPTGNRSLYAGPDSYNAAIDTDQSVRGLDGTQNSNPYMIAGINEGNLQNDWHLFVFHLQPSGTATPASNLSNTGVYRLDGSKIITGNDMLLDSTTSRLRFRAFAWSVGDDDDGTDAINLWSPRVEKVDGTEPSISELLASGNLWTNPNYQQTLPSPYVENVGIHPNPHRHNWLVATNDLDNASYWTLGPDISFESSTVGTTYANGETCWLMTNGSGPGQNGFINQTEYTNNLEWDQDNEYIGSFYVKRPDTGTQTVDITVRDGTHPARSYITKFTFNDESITTFTDVANDGVYYCSGGYEELPDNWYRIWTHVHTIDPSVSLDGDGVRLYLYNGPASNYDKKLYMMRPMLEIVPAGHTIKNVPRAYQEVYGEWDLGVTSIPEHQCSTEVELWPSDWSAPTAAFKTTFDREGGVWRTDYTQSAVNMSSEHVGDGWYKLTTSISGTTSNSSIVEGDNMRVVFYPTQFDPDKDITAFSLISAPFIGMTGSLDVSSVPHTRGVLE